MSQEAGAVHELGLTQGVVDMVTQRPPEAKVTCVRLEVGALSRIVADSVRFCFELVIPGTNLKGATLGISEPPAGRRCRGCGAEFEPGELLPLCRCGSADVEVLSGQDLRIISVEFAS